MSTMNFPYRGIETHGVHPNTTPDVDPEEADYGATRGVAYEAPEKEPDPIPVRVVPQGGGEFRTWYVIREYVRTGTQSRMIVPRDLSRTSITIKNLHATDNLVLNSQSFADVNAGFPLAAGASQAMDTNAEVWALSATSNDIPIAVMVQTSVDL
jgi:hypothetical protein